MSQTIQNTNNQSLLQQQQNSQQQINDILEKYSDQINCGPDCQKDRKIQDLRTAYLDAEENIQTAPLKLEETRKNYYVYTEGTTYYNKLLEEKLKKKADKIEKLITKNFNDEVKNANTMNSYLNTAIINSNYTKDLLKVYLDKNEALKIKLRNTHGDILTNDRKTYYEVSALDSLNKWYTAFLFLYFFFVIILFLAFFLTPNNLSMGQKIIIGLIVILYPFLISSIVNFITEKWNATINRLPKNVYNNL